MRVAFDVGGVISKYPDLIKELINKLHLGGAEIHVISDMHDAKKIVKTLLDNGVVVPEAQVHSAYYAKYGEACKAILCEELKIDILIDDFIGYVAAGPGAPIRLLVMPDATKPYYADSWKTDGSEGDFGRRWCKRDKIAETADVAVAPCDPDTRKMVDDSFEGRRSFEVKLPKLLKEIRKTDTLISLRACFVDNPRLTKILDAEIERREHREMG
jgi:hypothetical protein